MIKIGNILIDPNSIDTVLMENKGPVPNKERGFEHIQIIYKSGVVKNFLSSELGIPYNEFIDTLMAEIKKAEDRKLLRIMTAVNQTTHG